jgi:hypothetical protein
MVKQGRRSGDKRRDDLCYREDRKNKVRKVPKFTEAQLRHRRACTDERGKPVRAEGQQQQQQHCGQYHGRAFR